MRNAHQECRLSVFINQYGGLPLSDGWREWEDRELGREKDDISSIGRNIERGAFPPPVPQTFRVSLRHAVDSPDVTELSLSDAHPVEDDGTRFDDDRPENHRVPAVGTGGGVRL